MSNVAYEIGDESMTIVTATIGEDSSITYECRFEELVSAAGTSKYVEFSNIPYGTTFTVRDRTTSAVLYEDEYLFDGESCSEIIEEDVIVGVQGTIREDTPDPTVTVIANYDWE